MNTTLSRNTHEKLGLSYAQKLSKHLNEKKARFLCDADNSLHILLDGKRIPLNFSPDNRPLASLLLNTCNVSTLSPAAHAAIQRIQVDGDKLAERVHFRKFSALSDGHLYIPIEGGQLLSISTERVERVANGENPDSIWLEHPHNAPFKYTESDPRPGLTRFERLLMKTQGCKVPEMAWFVVMHEALFPYVRDLCPARFLVAHIGPSQHGKTSGAQRFTLLHGLGEVLGDFSVASLGNLGDNGLLVMDNREQSNFTPPFVDFCLYLSTGAQRGRSHADGTLRINTSRPATVFTTIEGAWKDELKRRVIEVEYHLPGPARIHRGPLEEEIREHRDEILSSLVPVLQHYLQVRRERRPTPNPVPEFEEHFSELCHLLRAYGEVAGKPAEWSERLITKWASVVAGREPEESYLEQPILRIFDETSRGLMDGDLREYPITHEGKTGKLYVTECGSLLSMLQRLNLRDHPLPKNTNGLGQRLRSTRFQRFQFLDEQSGLKELRRTKQTRPIGFFIEDDEVTTGDNGEKKPCHHVTSESTGLTHDDDKVTRKEEEEEIRVRARREGGVSSENLVTLSPAEQTLTVEQLADDKDSGDNVGASRTRHPTCPVCHDPLYGPVCGECGWKKAA
jgi:hypothetical protein